MKKILITGAFGFIGSHLVDYLIKDKQPKESLRLMVSPWGKIENLSNNIFEAIPCDIRDKECVDRAVEDVAIVYHLASKTGYDGGDYEYFKDTNVDGTRNLLEAAKKHKVKKFIFFSSSGVYGLPATAGDIRNYNEKTPKNYSEGYGHSKFAAENLLLKAASDWGLHYIILRPTTVYGPRDQGGLYQLVKVIKAGHFFFIGNAQNKMDYVYIEDVVRAARTLEKKDIVNEDYIIGSGMPITQEYMVETICKRLGKSMPGIHIPKSVALVASYLIKYISKIIGIKPIFFPNRVKVLTSDYYFDIGKLKRAIGYKPQLSFKQGVNSTISWLISEKKLL